MQLTPDSFRQGSRHHFAHVFAERGFGAAANWNALMDISDDLTKEEKEQEFLERQLRFFE